MEYIFSFFLGAVLIVMNVGYVLTPMTRQRLMSTRRAVGWTALMLGAAGVFFGGSWLLSSPIPGAVLDAGLAVGHVAGLLKMWQRPPRRGSAKVVEAPVESTAGWTADHFYELLRRAESLPPSKINIGQALRNGREFREKGNDDAALVNFLMAVRGRAENPYPYVHIGKICMDKGLKREAKKYLELALRNSGGITNDRHRNTFDAEVLALLRELREKEKQ